MKRHPAGPDVCGDSDEDTLCSPGSPKRVRTRLGGDTSESCSWGDHTGVPSWSPFRGVFVGPGTGSPTLEHARVIAKGSYGVVVTARFGGGGPETTPRQLLHGFLGRLLGPEEDRKRVKDVDGLMNIIQTGLCVGGQQKGWCLDPVERYRATGGTQNRFAIKIYPTDGMTTLSLVLTGIAIHRAAASVGAAPMIYGVMACHKSRVVVVMMEEFSMSLDVLIGEAATVPFTSKNWRSGFLTTAVGHAALSLSACHAIGIVHNDVKPQNIVLQVRRQSPSSTSSVLHAGCPVDFDLSSWTLRAHEHAVFSAFPGPGPCRQNGFSVMGASYHCQTVGFRAPEIMAAYGATVDKALTRGRRVKADFEPVSTLGMAYTHVKDAATAAGVGFGTQTDVYAFGVSLFQMLCGDKKSYNSTFPRAHNTKTVVNLGTGGPPATETVTRAIAKLYVQSNLFPDTASSLETTATAVAAAACLPVVKEQRCLPSLVFPKGKPGPLFPARLREVMAVSRESEDVKRCPTLLASLVEDCVKVDPAQRTTLFDVYKAILKTQCEIAREAGCPVDEDGPTPLKAQETGVEALHSMATSTFRRQVLCSALSRAVDLAGVSKVVMQTTPTRVRGRRTILSYAAGGRFTLRGTTMALFLFDALGIPATDLALTSIMCYTRELTQSYFWSSKWSDKTERRDEQVQWFLKWLESDVLSNDAATDLIFSCYPTQDMLSPLEDPVTVLCSMVSRGTVGSPPSDHQHNTADIKNANAVVYDKMF